MCQFFYPEYITSAILPYQTAKYLAKYGRTVDVICGYPKEYVSKNNENVNINETVDNVSIHRVKYLQFSRSNKLSRLINYFSIVFSMLLQLPRIRNYKSIMVYSNPPVLPLVAILANMMFKTKIIFVCYDVYPEIAEKTDVLTSNSIISKVMRRINNQLFKRASSVVVLSEDMKQFIMKNRRIESNKIKVIPNWATEESSEYQRNDTTVQLNPSPFTVSYLGNMGIPQDLDTILDAINSSRLKNNPDFLFIFAGHGNQKSKVERFVEENGLMNVQINGFLTGEKFEDVINKTDAFLITLKKELLGLAVPSKFYTYLLQGKKMINIMSNKADISKEIEKHNLGITVSNGNHLELAKKIEKMSTEKLEVENTSIYYKHYSKRIQLEKYNELITEILGGERIVQR